MRLRKYLHVPTISEGFRGHGRQGDNQRWPNICCIPWKVLEFIIRSRWQVFLLPRNAKVCLLKRLSFAKRLSLRTTRVSLGPLLLIELFAPVSSFFFNAKPKLMGQIQTSMGLENNPQCRSHTFCTVSNYVLHEYSVSVHIQPPIPCLALGYHDPLEKLEKSQVSQLVSWAERPREIKHTTHIAPQLPGAERLSTWEKLAWTTPPISGDCRGCCGKIMLPCLISFAVNVVTCGCSWFSARRRLRCTPSVNPFIGILVAKQDEKGRRSDD